LPQLGIPGLGHLTPGNVSRERYVGLDPPPVAKQVRTNPTAVAGVRHQVLAVGRADQGRIFPVSLKRHVSTSRSGFASSTPGAKAPLELLLHLTNPTLPRFTRPSPSHPSAHSATSPCSVPTARSRSSGDQTSWLIALCSSARAWYFLNRPGW